MQADILKKIASDFAGLEAEKLIDLLQNKKNVNEFLIAKKLNMTINQTRNMLYKLADEGIVTFIRKKDKKKGGWYTYFWTLKTEKSLVKYQEKIIKKIEQLNQELNNREKESFFHCDNCGAEYNEEDSLLNEYTCPECGETLKMNDTTALIKNIKNEIRKNKTILEELNKEVDQIKLKDKKTKERRLKVEIKKKGEERKKKAENRKKEAKRKTTQNKKRKSAKKKNKKLSKKRRK